MKLQLTRNEHIYMPCRLTLRYVTDTGKVVFEVNLRPIHSYYTGERHICQYWVKLHPWDYRGEAQVSDLAAHRFEHLQQYAEALSKGLQTARFQLENTLMRKLTKQYKRKHQEPYSCNAPQMQLASPRTA